MAGESRGKLSEQVAEVIIQRSVDKKYKGSKGVFSQHKPSLGNIKLDLFTGDDKDNPTSFFMVNSSTSAHDSDKKYWRNVAEVFDVKTNINPESQAINLVFKSDIKPELIRLTALICDQSVLLDTLGGDIEGMVEAVNRLDEEEAKLNLNQLLNPSDGKYLPRLDKGISDAAEIISSNFEIINSKNNELWEFIKNSRSKGKLFSGSPRKTFLRRGISRWIAIREEDREYIFMNYNRDIDESRLSGDYLIKLGMASKDLGSIRIKNNSQTDKLLDTIQRDLTESADLMNKIFGSNAYEVLQQIISNSPDEMKKNAGVLLDYVKSSDQWLGFFIKNWDLVTNPSTLLELMMLCRSDRSINGKVITKDPQRVWIHDLAIAIIKSAEGNANDFGYSRLSLIAKSDRLSEDFTDFSEHILSSLNEKEKKKAERWITKTFVDSKAPGVRGYTDWLSLKSDIGPHIVGIFAFSIAKLLRSIDPSKIEASAVNEMLTQSIWNKLATHPDFEPLAGLVRQSLGADVHFANIPTVMSDLAGKTVQNSNFVRVLKFSNGVIFWKSVTDSGKSHKKKELAAIGTAIKYGYDGSNFYLRKEIERTILIVDGTFNNEEIEYLLSSGWSEIYYADEIEEISL